MARRLIVLASLMALGALFVAPSAHAAFGIERWEALTCKENTDTPANFGEVLPGFPPLSQSPGQCTKSSSSESKWFKQAAGHPPFALTDFTLNTYSAPTFKGFPEGFVKDIVVDTPEGLSVNPEATAAKCTVEQLKANPPECPPQSLVGAAYLTVAAAAPPCESPPFPVAACPQARAKLPVYNVVPFDGVPSMVGLPDESRWGTDLRRRLARARSISTSPSRSVTSTRRTGPKAIRRSSAPGLSSKAKAVPLGTAPT